MCSLTVENVIVSGAFLIQSFISIILTFHLSSPSHFSHLILDCNVFPSLCIFVRNSSLLHLYDVMDLSLPSLFPFPLSGFSFLFFNFCPFFSSFVHYLPFQPPPLSFLSCRFPSTLFTLLYTSFINPSPIHATTLHHPLVSSFFFLCLQHWLTELEIFAMIFAAAVHDYEHTGTTNNFHIQTR